MALSASCKQQQQPAILPAISYLLRGTFFRSECFKRAFLIAYVGVYNHVQYVLVWC